MPDFIVKKLANLAGVIQQVNQVTAADIFRLAQGSYELATEFLSENVGKKWLSLINGEESANEDTTI